ncbi:MAG: 5-formyltetrahydrofolate cyclo-ligase [Lachnospiraceae bacterium]|nr:5-formyltetrahydrofolate cyclo-ligase [Lachnospiraceae bacterium]
MDKKEARRAGLQARGAMSESERLQCDSRIQRQIRRMDWYQQAEYVLSYASFRSEACTDVINQWILEDGKSLYLPKTYPDRNSMEFYRVQNLAELTAGYQGIQEPAEGEAFDAQAVERTGREEAVLMLMPGAAFDKEGNRVGYGGGYYDRYLAEHGAAIGHRVMLAYAVQQMERIQAEEYDVRPERIVFQ